MVHLDNNVATADKFAFDVKLWKGRPVRIGLQAVANLLVIPRYGVVGACATTLVSQFLIFLAAMVVIHQQRMAGPGVSPWLYGLAAGGMFALPLLVSADLTGWALAGLPVAVLASHLLLCRTGFWNEAELGWLKSWHLAW